VHELAEQPERRSRTGEEEHQDGRIDDEDGARVTLEAVHIEQDELRRHRSKQDAFGEDDGVHHAELPPVAPVPAYDEEREELHGEDDRQ